ncbi:MAG: DNA polymerase III subunit gamma/tau, partial [Hyphomicrobiaceae bacterium]
IGAEAASEGLSAEEKRRAAGLAAGLSMALLTRAWQMLLKGLDEVSRAYNPSAAAEMVLIRLCYTADLPSPDEIIKALGGGAVAAPRRAAVPAGVSSEGAATRAVSASPAQAPAGGRREAPTRTLQPAGGDDFDGDDDGPDPLDDVLPVYDDAERWSGEDGVPVDLAVSGTYADPRSFEDVIALLGEHREARLKYHVEEHVSLVRFDHATGAIDVFLLDGAPAEVPNELREKLNSWTGRRWVVMLSKAKGQPPFGETKRQRIAAEIDELRLHPAMKAVFEAFPDARIDDVRNVARAEGDVEDGSATG